MFLLLDVNEKARVASYHADRHKQEFLIARALLRILIAGYKGCAPGEVHFSYGPQGKPALAPDLGQSQSLAFNMSHSADTVLIAMTSGIDVGVDVEQVSSGVLCAKAISQSCINPRELPVLHRVPSHDRPRMLLRYWTHKEAYLKAIGCGLSSPPHQVTVDFLHLQQSTIFQEDTPKRSPMFGHDLPVGCGYTGAIVSPSPILELRHFWI